MKGRVGTADLVPTPNYAMFETAEQLKMTVRTLLTGTTAPMSLMEEYLWRRYRLAQARLRQQANRTTTR